MLGATDVLSEWFGSLAADGTVATDKVSSWWKKDPDFDASLRERFGALLELAGSGSLQWSERATDTLAEIIVLDQFSRNIHRDSARMYTGDLRAQALATRLVEAGGDRELPWVYRTFVYMPFMHAEALAEQELAIRCFERLVDDAPEVLKGTMQQYLKFAHAHRDIVARFGRFPHRNAILGRQTTAEEAEFLKQPGSSF